YAHVVAPSGAVVINGNSELVGSVKCDRLTINGSGVIRAANVANEMPTAQPQTVTAAEDLEQPITLTGTDPENAPLTFSIVNPPLRGTLTGSAPNLVYKAAP